MITKRSKFWTIVFAFLPGAGHMYNGFMKLGVSFMGLFFGLWMVASVINIGPIAFLAPVIWFYAFFDCINKVFQDDDEFYIQEDYYLISRENLEKMNLDIFRGRNLIVGILLIIVGIYALWNNVVLSVISRYHLLPEAVYEVLVNLGYIIPQLVVAGLIIWAGITLITGKKKELEAENVTMIPAEQDIIKTEKEEMKTES